MSGYGPDAPDDHVCSCGHPWTDHDAAGCGLLAPCTPEPDDRDFAEEHPVTDRDSAAPPAVVPVGGLGGRSGTSGHPQGGSEPLSPVPIKGWMDPHLPDGTIIGNAYEVEIKVRGMWNCHLSLGAFLADYEDDHGFVLIRMGPS